MHQRKPGLLWLLLLLPYAGLLWVPFYNGRTPELLGFPRERSSLSPTA
jgi:hypothetical protein